VTADTEAKVVHEVAFNERMRDVQPGAFDLFDHISAMTYNRGDYDPAPAVDDTWANCVLDLDALEAGSNELINGVVDTISWSLNRTATLTVEQKKHMEVNEHVSFPEQYIRVTLGR
jgi:hypothetical protein